MAKKISKPDERKFEILQQLTPEQKDKLLLKLFRKDPLLVEKLAFEFLKTEDDLPAMRKKIEVAISERISKNFVVWDTPGDLMMEMRGINSRITEHVKITKDKLGEVKLTVLMLNTAFNRFWEMLHAKQDRAGTFSEYVLKRAENIIEKANKLSISEKEEVHSLINHLLGLIKKYPKTAKMRGEYKLPEI